MNYIPVFISCLLIIAIGLLASGHGFWAGVLSVVPIKMLTATWIVGSSDAQLIELGTGMVIGSIASLGFAMVVMIVANNQGNHWFAMGVGMGVWIGIIILGRMV